MILSARPVFLAISAALLAGPAFGAPAAGLRGAVATAHPLATEAGVAMLRSGGNAVDAAVAAAFTLAVVEPFSSGIGGGGFALTRMNKKGAAPELRFLDFREVAPRTATADMYLRDGKADPQLSRDGILGVAVPGAVAGYLELHGSYGALPISKVLAPALAAAEKGFLVTERYRDAATERLELLRADPEAAVIFLSPGKTADEPRGVPALGARIVQKDLSKTLRVLAKEGAAAFYTGRLAKLLVADMKARGGLVSAEDLAGYKVRQREPLVGTYRGRAVASAPPPSSGGTILLTILNVLESHDKPRFRDAAFLHSTIEGMRTAFADRALLGDPDFVTDVPTLVPALVAKPRARALAKTFAQKARSSSTVVAGEGLVPLPSVAPPMLKESSHTTHLSVVDAEGNAVALTTTVNYEFGSGVVAKGTGILWNDQMDDFAIAPGVANVYGIVGSARNAVAPGKVPLSSMSPTMVFSGATVDAPVRLVVGSPGGSRIPTTVLQAIINHLDFGAPIDQAIGLGRLHHQHLPEAVFYEPFALEPATVEALRGRGHLLEASRWVWSNATAIAIDPDTGVRTAAADPRHDGTALAE